MEKNEVIGRKIIKNIVNQPPEALDGIIASIFNIIPSGDDKMIQVNALLSDILKISHNNALSIPIDESEVISIISTYFGSEINDSLYIVRCFLHIMNYFTSLIIAHDIVLYKLEVTYKQIGRQSTIELSVYEDSDENNDPHIFTVYE